MSKTLVKLIKPHKHQKEILQSLLDPSVFFTVSVIGRQFGKTMLAENIAIYWALNDPGCNIFFVSPTDNQNTRIFKDIVEAVYGSGCIKSKNKSKGGSEIAFSNGSSILFRSAASEDSLRGQPVEYMIIDEAAFIKKETIESVLLPMMAVKGKKMYVSTTPKGKNWVYDWFLKGQEAGSKYKSFRFSSYDSPFCNQGLIDIFRESMSEKLFQQEIEAQFVDSASVFNNIQELMCLNKQEAPKEGESYYGGIDIGFINDASVLTILNQDGNMVNYYKFEKVEAPELILELIKLSQLWNFKSIFIENNNQGLVIYQDLKRKIKNLVEFNTNSKSKPEIINNLVYLFNKKEIKLIVDEYLRIELEAFIFKQKEGRVRFMADNGFHDDCVMSLAIARECFNTQNLTKRKFIKPTSF